MTRNKMGGWLRLARNNAGAAALMSVVITIVLIAVLALNFWTETGQKQSGSAIDYTSANAFFIAEAGFRYAEKCILQTDPNCPCTALPGGCSVSASLGSPFVMNKTFGDGNGAFSVTFDVSALPDVRVKSVGTFNGATREISRLLCQSGGSCPMSSNAATVCGTVSLSNNSSTTGPTQTGVCNINAILPVTFSPDPSLCPDTNYPDFSAGSHLDGGGNLTQTTFCNFSLTGTTHAKMPSGATLTVAKAFTMANTSRLQVNGTSKINVGGALLLKDAADIYLSASTNLSFQTNTSFTMQNSSSINKHGNAADVLGLIIGPGNLSNSVAYYGGLYGDNLTLDLDNSADIKGSVVAQDVTLANNATIIYDPSAGVNASLYNVCGVGGGSGATNCTGGVDPKNSWAG